MTISVGDVVYTEGASAILGDVVQIVQYGDGSAPEAIVVWRETKTWEQLDDLIPTGEQVP